MTVFELGDGKQVIVGKNRITVWANRGGLGVDLTPDQQREIGLAMFVMGSREKRKCRSGDGS